MWGSNLKKLKSFTVLEILIVLSLTTIVVALALSVLRIVTKNRDALSVQVFNENQLTQLKFRLHHNVNQYPQVFWNHKLQEITFVSPLDTVKLSFNDEQITYNESVYKAKLNQIILYHQGVEIQDSGFIDAFNMEIEIGSQKARIFAYKFPDVYQKMISNAN